MWFLLTGFEQVLICCDSYKRKLIVHFQIMASSQYVKFISLPFKNVEGILPLKCLSNKYLSFIYNLVTYFSLLVYIYIYKKKFMKT